LVGNALSVKRKKSVWVLDSGGLESVSSFGKQKVFPIDLPLEAKKFDQKPLACQCGHGKLVLSKFYVSQIMLSLYNVSLIKKFNPSKL
jgi:hypothetical protein